MHNPDDMPWIGSFDYQLSDIILFIANESSRWSEQERRDLCDAINVVLHHRFNATSHSLWIKDLDDIDSLNDCLRTHIMCSDTGLPSEMIDTMNTRRLRVFCEELVHNAAHPLPDKHPLRQYSQPTFHISMLKKPVDIDGLVAIEETSSDGMSWNKGYFEQRLEQPGYHIVMARANNKPIGFMMLYEKDETIAIERMRVHSDFSNQGVEQRLLKWVDECLLKDQLTECIILVDPDEHDLQSVLSRQGFQPTHLIVGGKDYDAVDILWRHSDDPARDLTALPEMFTGAKAIAYEEGNWQQLIRYKHKHPLHKLQLMADRLTKLSGQDWQLMRFDEQERAFISVAELSEKEAVAALKDGAIFLQTAEPIIGWQDKIKILRSFFEKPEEIIQNNNQPAEKKLTIPASWVREGYLHKRLSFDTASERGIY